MKVYLETQRLILRQFEDSDWDFIKDLDSDPEVVKWISAGVPSDDKEVNRAMGIFMDLQKKYNGELGFFMAHEKESNKAIGWFHLRPLKSEWDNTKKLEIGYRLRREFWGKGYASEGSIELVKKGFEYGADEIWAHAIKGNKASTKVMEKAGLSFHHEEIYEPWPSEDKLSVWYMVSKL